MTHSLRKFFAAFMIIAILASLFAFTTTAFAADTNGAAETTETVESAGDNENTVMSSKAWAAGIGIGIAAAAAAIGMGIAIAKSVSGIAKQPEAEGKIRTALMLGLVFIETAIIYALIIAILIIFVL